MPAEAYKKSSRRWNGQEAEQEYSGNMKVRIVNDRGYFNLRQGGIFMGNPFAGIMWDKGGGGEKREDMV
jgi:hypothetical protein